MGCQRWDATIMVVFPSPEKVAVCSLKLIMFLTIQSVCMKSLFKFSTHFHRISGVLAKENEN